jgi:hypothetical protein
MEGLAQPRGYKRIISVDIKISCFGSAKELHTTGKREKGDRHYFIYQLSLLLMGSLYGLQSQGSSTCAGHPLASASFIAAL